MFSVTRPLSLWQHHLQVFFFSDSIFYLDNKLLILFLCLKSQIVGLSFGFGVKSVGTSAANESSVKPLSASNSSISFGISNTPVSSSSNSGAKFGLNPSSSAPNFGLLFGKSQESLNPLPGLPEGKPLNVNTPLFGGSLTNKASEGGSQGGEINLNSKPVFTFQAASNSSSTTSNTETVAFNAPKDSSSGTTPFQFWGGGNNSAKPPNGSSDPAQPKANPSGSNLVFAFPASSKLFLFLFHMFFHFCVYSFSFPYFCRFFCSFYWSVR